VNAALARLAGMRLNLVWYVPLFLLVVYYLVVQNVSSGYENIRLVFGRFFWGIFFWLLSQKCLVLRSLRKIIFTNSSDVGRAAGWCSSNRVRSHGASG
jgi:RsiW-degrading membrane proteinase PrsW (M82 family)